MDTRLQHYTGDHRFLLDQVRRQVGLADPVAIDLDAFATPLRERARKGALLPIDGVLVRDWDPDGRRRRAGASFGMRLYEINGIRFVEVSAYFDGGLDGSALDFFAVDRKDYTRLYRLAVAARRDQEPRTAGPILSDEQRQTLWQNTIGFLEEHNLAGYRQYGIRPRRGLLLLGPPGNGKTMACRWVWETCRQRRWEYRLVTPNDYRKARSSCNPQQEVSELFTLDKKGVIFFDDMDIALRDRETVQETDDQAIFLTALDGITVNEGVVFVFTSNCRPELIDPAFRRPGRLDLVLHFRAPDAVLRRRLMERWHAEIRQHIDLDRAIASTDGCSFAELEEIKSLLVMHRLESERWDWSCALLQFDRNRQEMMQTKRRVGFAVST